MIVETDEDLKGIQEISNVVAITLKEMREYARIGMTTKELDEYGAEILKNFGAKSAPFVTYKFPGWTCISINNEMAHGIPSSKVLKEGDLVNGKSGGRCPLAPGKIDPFRQNKVAPSCQNKNVPCRKVNQQGIFM